MSVSFKGWLRRCLLAAARARPAGWLIRALFGYASFLIPVRPLRSTPALLAFYHPSPAYPVHVLIVPRRPYRSLADVPETDQNFLRDLWATVQYLAGKLGLESTGYRLIVNGGAYQEVPILHVHLIAEREGGHDTEEVGVLP